MKASEKASTEDITSNGFPAASAKPRHGLTGSSRSYALRFGSDV